MGKQESRGTALLVIEVVLTPLALILTVIRISLRRFSHKLGWDDAAIVAAMISRLVSFSFTILSISDGYGRHQQHLSKEAVKNIIKWTWANEVLIFATVCFIKISICLFVLRIKKTGWLKWFLYAMMLGLVITNGSCIIVLLAQCQPLRAYWDRSAGTCWNVHIYNGFIYVAVGYSVVSDLACSLLPLVILWHVKISTRVKATVCGLMSLGLIASGCAGVRAALSVQNESNDLTWALVLISDWAFCEANLGIIAANLALSRMAYIFLSQRITRKRSTEGSKAYNFPTRFLQERSFNAIKRNAHRAFRPLKSQETNATSNEQIALDRTTIMKTTDFDLEEHQRVESRESGDTKV